jgi:hypothetical protein
MNPEGQNLSLDPVKINLHAILTAVKFSYDLNNASRIKSDSFAKYILALNSYCSQKKVLKMH